MAHGHLQKGKRRRDCKEEVQGRGLGRVVEGKGQVVGRAGAGKVLRRSVERRKGWEVKGRRKRQKRSGRSSHLAKQLPKAVTVRGSKKVSTEVLGTCSCLQHVLLHTGISCLVFASCID
jgi:hypothetical protein